MTHAQFHQAIAAFAGGKYYTTKVEVGTHGDGSHSFVFQAYQHDFGWSEEFATAEECIASFTAPGTPKIPENFVKSIGDVAADLMAAKLLDAERI